MATTKTKTIKGINLYHDSGFGRMFLCWDGTLRSEAPLKDRVYAWGFQFSALVKENWLLTHGGRKAKALIVDETTVPVL